LSGRGWIEDTLQEDHTGKEGGLRITNLFHPPSLPDLNPIKNMWGILKGKLRKRPRIPSSEAELWSGIQEEWEAIPVATVNRVAEGMEKRRIALLAARGWSIDK
jgi:transposase